MQRTWLALGMALTMAGCGSNPAPPAPVTATAPGVPATTRETTMTTAQLKTLVERLRPLCEKKHKPADDDWLAKHREPGQTFAEFLAYRPAPQVETHRTLYVQPLGDFTATQRRLIDETAEFLGDFYAVRVKTLETLPLSVIPASARRVHPQWGDKQIKTGYVEGMLRDKRPRDAVALIALTTSDLYPADDWNFVFGEASLEDRVGVWSLYRYGDPETEYDVVRKRMVKVAAHETGHMLGIYHCTAYECSMNGSNHLRETDAAPMWFCAECDPKVIFACRADAPARYEKLAAWAKAHKLMAEATFWQKQRDALP